jgi:hypothetical protein
MTPEQFVEYIEREIDYNTRLNENAPHGNSYATSRMELLRDVKEKFLSIPPPSQSTN